MLRSFPLLLLLSLLSLTTAKTNLRPAKKYLRCSVETFGCGGHDRVNLCHYNGKEFVTMCVRSHSSIVEHLHDQDYCGQCVESSRTPFEDSSELKQAVDDYLTDKSSHKRLSVKYGYPMGQWDVSKVQDFSHLFAKRNKFNEDIELWDMQSATNLDFMFWHAHKFDRDLSHWNVKNVQSMERTFFGAESFNANLNQWNISSVTNLMGTFWRAASFNSPLNDWDTSRVVNMTRLFSDATAFNQPLNQWNTSSVQDMTYMFLQATSFQQDLTTWNVTNVHNCERMFAKTPYFQSSKIQQNLLASWKEQLPPHANTESMFTAPRDVSLRAQRLEALQLDVRAVWTETAFQQNQTGNVDAPEGIEEADQALSREILCHGGVCM